MAIAPDPELNQKLREQPARDYCLRLAQEMKKFPPPRRLADLDAEAAQAQSKAVSASLEESWSKAFHHHHPPKKINESTDHEIADHLHDGPPVQARMASLVEYPPSKWLLEQELAAQGKWKESAQDVYAV